MKLLICGPSICFAADDGTTGADLSDFRLPNAAAVSGGQIALTAHNNGDGTWSVMQGPGGPVVKDGISREEAYAIVGAPTGPYEPKNKDERRDADKRVEVEQGILDESAGTALQSDEELGTVPDHLKGFKNAVARDVAPSTSDAAPSGKKAKGDSAAQPAGGDKNGGGS
jgi:hypothetical protein